MEIGDLNEFEFDLSDVAAFESVEDDDDNNQNNNATTTAPATADPNANATVSSNGNDEPQQQEHPQTQLEGQLPHQQPQPPPAAPQQQHQLQQLQQLQLQHHQQQLQPQSQQQQPTTISLASGAPTAGKILLVPINSKPGTPGYTFLLSPLTMAGNKKQIIQLAPSSSAQANKQQQHQLQLQQQQQQLHQQQQQLQQQQLHHQQQQQQQLQLQLQQQNLVPKRKPCNCTKSQCLKLYCDCFANGEFCSGCNCTNCFNSLSKEKERQKAISSCLERNPEAFRPKIGKAVKSVGEPAPDSIERRHTKGCNCKRSGCLKNYCECYEAKILCSNLCKCCGCKNYEESFERKSLMQLANSASESARGILKNLLPTNNSSSTGKEFTKCFITDKVIHASLMCLLQSAQQAEKDGIPATSITNLIQVEMGKCLRMIVDSAAETSSPKKR